MFTEFIQTSPLVPIILGIPVCVLVFKFFRWLSSIGGGNRQLHEEQAQYHQIRNLSDRREMEQITKLSSKLTQHGYGQRHDNHNTAMVIHGSPSDLNHTDFDTALSAAHLIRENDRRARLWFTEPERPGEPLHTMQGEPDRKYNICKSAGRGE